LWQFINTLKVRDPKIRRERSKKQHHSCGNKASKPRQVAQDAILIQKKNCQGNGHRRSIGKIDLGGHFLAANDQWQSNCGKPECRGPSSPTVPNTQQAECKQSGVNHGKNYAIIALVRINITDEKAIERIF